MVIKQLLADFQLPETRNSCITDADGIVNTLTELLKLHVGVTGPTFSTNSKGFGRMLIYEDGDKRQCTVRMFPDGMVTIDIIFNMDNQNDEQVTQIFLNLKQGLRKNTSLVSPDVIPPIARGCDIKKYYDTSDGRMKEYDFDKVIYHGSSEYQDILIVHSPQFGNMLFLDDEEMLADSDIAYTRAILGNGRENFKDKTLLILGGGDGGILHEVLKEDPKFVTMVEIDQLVIDVARKHLRNICGDTMDSLNGRNYEIIVQDCFVELRKYIKEGKVFDYILNDLTDLPIGAEGCTESRWGFIKDVLDLSLQALDKKGKYFAQGTNGANNHLAHERYEKILSSSSCSVDFSKELVFVPSFLELWTFYEVWKK
ncbi:spermine synthase [Exaiptasia diaphana]|uniref:PABS domain-containing protein n=1 Tax=Exaiptasia diaphana TaxID=2652724 RepID=A0A913Y483_EXADI|nr:spermine synthase [Exaiptasia diaphana]XP_020914179.1 spermine synthase [Exaiptasia diaphana]XP_028518847.1 spermine synthase [Exaiptasia diaphana]